MIAAVRVMQEEKVVVPFFVYCCVLVQVHTMLSTPPPQKKHAFGIGMEMNWYMTVLFQQ